MDNKTVIRRPSLPVDKYTIIANEVLRDSTVSYRARGIYAYLASHIDGWETSVDKIAEAGGCGRASVKAGLVELKDAGYIESVQQRDNENRFGGATYILREAHNARSSPQVDFPPAGNPVDGKTVDRKSTGKEDHSLEDHLQEDHSNLSPSQSSGSSMKRPDPLGPYTDEFDVWYSTYPRRQGKRAAFKAFVSAVYGTKTRPGRVTFDGLLDATKLYADSRVGAEPHLTPHPSTWLNQERWADELLAPSTGLAGFDWGKL